MDATLASQRLPGSRVHYCDRDGELLLFLPTQPRRMATSFGSAFVGTIAFLLAVVYVSNGWMPVAVVFGSLAAIFLSIAFATLADCYLRETSISISRNRVVAKTALYRQEQMREYTIDRHHRAHQWYARQRPGASFARPRGIEIGPDPYDAEKGSNWKDESKPRFGSGLSRGELDWLVWRINRFLDRDSPLAVADDEAAIREQPKPKDSKVRIVDDESGSWIIFPNTVETRTFTGIFQIVLGLIVPLFAWRFALQWQPPRNPGLPPLAVLIVSVFFMLGIGFFVSGLAQLFGRREIRITPATIVYRARLWGFAWRLTVRIAQVLSVGMPQNRPPFLDAADVAPANGCIIRTANREIRFSSAVPKGNGPWVMQEVARRIAAARLATTA